jgi:GNAT superfamily N-acetyltransferase
VCRCIASSYKRYANFTNIGFGQENSPQRRELVEEIAEWATGHWIGADGRLGGLVVRKDERGDEIGRDAGLRVLKLCTFKVAPHAQGHKVGELLLRKAVWHAQLNGYDLIYLTTYPKQRMLLDLLRRYGFEDSPSRGSGELLVAKPIIRKRLEIADGIDRAEASRLNYPRFSLDPPATLYAVPIVWPFHRQLFPEAAFLAPLPLFDDRSLYHGAPGRPGNTIRKVYVCRSAPDAMVGGDIVFFYQSKDEAAANSQSLTTVGVVERVVAASDLRELSRLTAGRSVFSETDLDSLCSSAGRQLKVIDFLHVQHLHPVIPLATLLARGLLRGAPQGVTRMHRGGMAALLPSMQFGFSL